MPDSEFGSDGQLHPAPAPLNPFTSGPLEPPPADQFAASEPGAAEQSTHDRIRAFEDESLGKDHPRHNHQVEKGSGSPFARLSDNQKAHHAALENLIAVEKEHAAAEANMAAIHAKLEAAVNRANETEAAIVKQDATPKEKEI